MWGGSGGSEISEGLESGRWWFDKGEEGLGVECILQVPGIAFLQGRSLQNILIRQPVNQGGFCGTATIHRRRRDL